MKGTLLRYPGGKAKIFPLIKEKVVENELNNKIYVEPFAGGFGIGLKSMLNNLFNGYIINDYDYHIYAFWHSIFYETNKFINMLDQVAVTLDTWHYQKYIYNNYKCYSIIDVGFSTFFLNRTNYSGIIKGGPLGGLTQQGRYKISCRFNKEELIKNIISISNYKNIVEIYNMDAIQFIDNIIIPRNNDLFINFDPPYVRKGAELYTNYYTTENHVLLQAKILQLPTDTQWIMTYDDCDLIRNLYCTFNLEKIKLMYTAGKTKEGNELLIKHI